MSKINWEDQRVHQEQWTASKANETRDKINDNIEKIDANTGKIATNTGKIDAIAGKIEAAFAGIPEGSRKVLELLGAKAEKVHEHTPEQVGLGNLPNVKSDAIDSNSADSLATSKAVYNARNWANIKNKPSSFTPSTHQHPGSGSVSTELGDSASASGTKSTALGSEANASKPYSTALGDSATASGSYSIALGESARASGYSSTALGRSATARGSYSIALGDHARASGDSSTALGDDARADENFEIMIGHSTANVRVRNGTSNISDQRDKTDIEDNDLGLAFLKKLQTRKWKNNPRDAYILKDKEDKIILDEKGIPKIDEEAYAKCEKKGTRIKRGLVAQEVQEVLDKNKITGDEFSALQDNMKKDKNPKMHRIYMGYNEFIAPLIKSVQELSTELEDLKKFIKDNIPANGH